MSSSPVERGVVDLLVESLELLRVEEPDAYRAMCARLAPRTVRLCIDGRAQGLAFAAAAVSAIGALSAAHIEIESSGAAVLAVVDAQASLIDAVTDDRLRLRGTCDDLLAFHDGFLLYIHGAVRAPSFPTLLRELRRGATASRQ